jgi:hypothetical protein
MVTEIVSDRYHRMGDCRYSEQKPNSFEQSADTNINNNELGDW